GVDGVGGAENRVFRHLPVYVIRRQEEDYWHRECIYAVSGRADCLLAVFVAGSLSAFAGDESDF
ncbi:hypothetical protein, partial [Erwinia amylovora]|uniref:hypothetical protein n=1 Tax=Erwinia amylovora TaxID=552 RepID=UPI003855CDAF